MEQQIKDNVYDETLSEQEKEKLIELSSSKPQEFTKKIIEYNLQKPIYREI